MDNKQERTVVHVEYNGQHYYFGSLSAIYTKFSPKDLGIALGTLRNYGLKEEKAVPELSVYYKKRFFDNDA